MLDLEKAKKELREKSYDEIQVSTAWTWGSRAAASFKNVKSMDREAKVSAFILGQEYLHEAIEHASLAKNEGLVELVKMEVSEYESEAIEDIEKSLKIDL